MAQKNNNKMNISYTIKAVDRFTKTHEKLNRQLNQLERKLSIMEALDPSIEITVRSRQAERQLSRTERRVQRIPKIKNIWVKVHGQADIDKFATKLRNIDEIMMQMGQGAIWMLLPSMGPMMAALAGGAGALASQLIGAGAALGAFSLVAVPAVKDIMKLDESVKRGSKEWKNLSKATRDTLTALDSFRDSWNKMQKEFREPTLEIFALGIKGAETALAQFKPTIEGSIGAVRELTEAFNANLGAEDVKSIFEWLGKTAGGYLVDLGKTMGNFLVGFMSLMEAFDPLAQDFADGFLNMSERFREWAATLDENQSFQNFLAYAREQGPILLDFIGNLINFLIALGKAMAPVGEQVLQYVNRFLEWAAAGLKNNEWIGKAIALFAVWRASMSIIGPILIVLIRSIGQVTTVLSKMWSGVKKVISIFKQKGPVITKVGQTLLKLARGPIGLVIQVVIALAVAVYQNWDSIKKWTSQTFTNVKNTISKAWNDVQAKWLILQNFAKILRQKFTEMDNTVDQKMNEIKKSISSKWENAKKYLSSINLRTIGKNIIQGLINGIKSVSVSSAIGTIASNIKNGFTNFFKIKSPSRLMEKDVGRWITLGVLEGLMNMSSKAEREAMIVANAISRPFEAMDKDFRFTAVGEARTAMTNARYASQAGTAQQSASQSGTGLTGPQQVILSIAGHEARGIISYISREQEFAKVRERKFKGR